MDLPINIVLQYGIINLEAAIAEVKKHMDPPGPESSTIVDNEEMYKLLKLDERIVEYVRLHPGTCSAFMKKGLGLPQGDKALLHRRLRSLRKQGRIKIVGRLIRMGHAPVDAWGVPVDDDGRALPNPGPATMKEIEDGLAYSEEMKTKTSTPDQRKKAVKAVLKGGQELDINEVCAALTEELEGILPKDNRTTRLVGHDLSALVKKGELSRRRMGRKFVYRLAKKGAKNEIGKTSAEKELSGMILEVLSGAEEPMSATEVRKLANHRSAVSSMLKKMSLAGIIDGVEMDKANRSGKVVKYSVPETNGHAVM